MGTVLVGGEGREGHERGEGWCELAVAREEVARGASIEYDIVELPFEKFRIRRRIRQLVKRESIQSHATEVVLSHFEQFLRGADACGKAD